MPTLRNRPICPQRGPILRVYVEVSDPRAEALRVAGESVPVGVDAIGLIDTGAAVVMIDPSLVQALRLKATGSALIHTASTGGKAYAVPTYDISLTLVDDPTGHVVRQPIRAVSHELFDGVQVLLGRDWLGTCRLVYDGEARTFTLDY